MTRQTNAPLEHITMDAHGRQARGYQGDRDAGYLVLDPPYQRGSVWTTDQRIALVRSWLMGVPVGAVVLNDRGARQWHAATGNAGTFRSAVIDGKQRIETALAWFDGDLAVPASWFPSEYVEATTTVPDDDGPYVTFHDLTDVGRRFVSSRSMLPAVTTTLGTIEEEAALYLLLNGGGTPQTQQDMANAALHARTT